MNTRDYKQFTVGEIYHIFNRGTAKMKIFCDRSDHLLFLNRLKENIMPVETPVPVKKYGYVRKVLPAGSFDLISYCLMPTHFHLLIRQNTDLPINVLISKICTGYAKCFNKKYKRVGGLFQDQFKSVLVESDEQLRWVIDYIHNNPIKDGLVNNLNNYEFSSYLDYVEKRKSAFLKKMPI